MKRIITLILAICMLLPTLPVFATGGLSWEMPSGYYTQQAFPYQPVNNYHSYQNSPNFTWPIIYGASYELVLTNDKELKDIAYEVKDIPVNMYTFNHTLEAGKDYYWAVRYKLNGKYSEWSEPRRLYIDEKALEYTVPEISEIGSKLKEHPYFFDAEDFNKLKKIDKNNEVYIKFKANVDKYVNTNTLSEVEIKTTASGNTDAMGYVAPSTEIFNSTLLYFITGEEKYKTFAFDGLEKIKKFNPEKIFTWDANSNTAEAIFIYKIAIVYDLFYQDMSAEMRADMIKLIENNLKRPFEHFAKNGSYEGSLYANPYDSHAWRINQCMIPALAIYNDSELGKKMFDFHFPMMATVLNPYTYQDGASGQGVFYGQPTDYIHVATYLYKSGILDLRKKGGFENNIINYLYRYPSNWVNNIGDAYNTKPQDTYQVKALALYGSASAATEEYREFAKWYLKHITGGNTQFYYSSIPEYVFENANQDTEIVSPYMLPNSAYFADPGWISMHSDLKDDNKVGMIFKSSWFGSLNHSHPDQNSFVIQGYGQVLASDSDYYDAYHSSFDLGFNKKTYAHNAITYDNGTGQPYNSISAKGKITGFVNQMDYKLAGGNAKQAYGTAISKADRDIIYIAPETYIVIDDLKTSGGNYTFEYWLNTTGNIGFYENKKGATITKGPASMEVRAHYPEKITPYYIDFFSGPDLIEQAKPTEAENATDKRLYFQTEKTEATKIVTTLDVHKTDDRARYIKEENFGDYLKLSFEDGSDCYINLTDKETIVTKDGIEFSGLAFIYNKDSFMLVKGTDAKMLGKKLVSSDVSVSVAVGKDEISVSNVDVDANVNVYTDIKPEKLIKHRDINYYDIMENEEVSGVLWNYADGAINLNLYPGTYTLYTDNKELPGKKGNGVIKLIIDGVTNEIPFESCYDINGKLTYDWWVEGFDGMYVVEDMKNVTITDVNKGDVIPLDNSVCIYVNGDNPEVKLKALNNKKIEISVNGEEKQVEALTDVKVRAVNFSEGGVGTKPVFWQRINDNTLQYFDNAMNTITYEFDVPADGKYDVAMSISTVSQATSDKALFVNGEIVGVFNVPATAVYSDLQGLRIKCQVELKAGKNKIKFLNLDNFRTIFDWVGLIKSEN